MSPANSNKLNALTGLRAVAALAVFFHHFMGIMDCRVIQAPIGGIAVSFFFVLSGFILVYVYKDRLKATSTRKFYFTRFARIWPLHVACLILILLLTPNVMEPSDFPWARTWSHWALLQAWYPTVNWLGAHNQVAWSISAEAFFYLMFPLLLLGTSRRFWIKYACLSAVTVGALIWLATSFGPASPVKEIANASLDPRTFVQFFPAFRLLEFMTGMATGMIFLRRSLPSTTADSNVSKGFRTARATVLEVLVLALSMGCFYLFTFIGVFAYLPRFGEPGIVANRWLTYSGGMFFHAAVIYVFARSGGWVSRFFGSRTMVFLGEISFAFYMIHYPLNLFVKQKYWFGSNFSLWYFALLTLALTIGVSAWLYFLVEVPAKAALVKWYEGKLRPRQLPAEMLFKPMQQLASTPMLRLMILLIVVPVVVTKIYERVDRKSFTAEHVLETVPSGFQPVHFGEQTELLAVDVVPRRDAMRINTVWRFSKPGTALMSLHFTGTTHGDRQQEIVCGPEDVGRPICTKLNVYQGKCIPADAIDISLSINGQEISPQMLQGDHAAVDNRYRVFSREQIKEGLRLSRLPVLRR